MTRRIPISSVTASAGPGSPGSFSLGATADNPSADWTSVFQGKFYRDALGVTETFYNSNGSARYTTQDPPPAGYQLIEATTFTVTGGAAFNGRYTVYTQQGSVNDSANESAVFGGGLTTVKVNEVVPSGIIGGSAFVTNVSTYYLLLPNESTPLVIPPGVNLTSRPVELFGRNFSGWGEASQQNLLRAVQHFAGSTAPANPFQGQLWYDTSTSIKILNIWDGASWSSVTSYRHTQAVSSATWVVTHNLNASPDLPLGLGRGIAHASFFVNDGGVMKPFVPSTVTYNSENQLTATFPVGYAGYALVRL